MLPPAFQSGCRRDVVFKTSIERGETDRSDGLRLEEEVGRWRPTEAMAVGAAGVPFCFLLNSSQTAIYSLFLQVDKSIRKSKTFRRVK